MKSLIALVVLAATTICTAAPPPKNPATKAAPKKGILDYLPTDEQWGHGLLLRYPPEKRDQLEKQLGPWTPGQRAWYEEPTTAKRGKYGTPAQRLMFQESLEEDGLLERTGRIATDDEIQAALNKGDGLRAVIAGMAGMSGPPKRPAKKPNKGQEAERKAKADKEKAAKARAIEKRFRDFEKASDDSR